MQHLSEKLATRRVERGAAAAYSFLILLVLAIAQPPAFAKTPPLNQFGDTDGAVVGWFRFLAGSGDTIENYGNFHACSNPAYSQANFTEIDGTRGGTTGKPAWVTGSATDMPSLDFTRANQHHVKLDDNSASCTTGNDPWDKAIANGRLFFANAWVKPEASLTCANLGNKYTVISKWDDSTKCSFKLYLEIVDRNGGGCNDADLDFAARALFNDSGATFSCASPCELSYPNSNISLTEAGTNGWVQVGIELDPEAGTATRGRITVNGRVDVGDAQKCQDLTAYPAGVDFDNNNQAIYIGIDDVSGSDGFEGKIGTIMIGHNVRDFIVDEAVGHGHVISHLDGNLSGHSVTGGDGYYSQYVSLQTTGAVLPSFDSTNARYGESIDFDGTDDYAVYVTSAFSSQVSGGTAVIGYTVEAWIRPSAATGNGEQTIVSRWKFNDDASCTDNAVGSAFRLYLDDNGKLNFDSQKPAGVIKSVTGNTVLQNNQWYHVAATLTNTATHLATNGAIYVFVDGQDDTNATPTLYGSAGVREVDTNFQLGATEVASPGTTCGSGGQADYFHGHIDEVLVKENDASNGTEFFNGGVVINEVNFKESEEKVELYVWDKLGHTLDLDNYSMRLCSIDTKSFTFDDACGNCASKVVDPGDVITLVFDNTSPPQDTSCNDGSAGSCTWYTGNTASATALDASDITDTLDGVILYGTDIALNSNLANAYAAAIDGVIWEGNVSQLCRDTLSRWTRGHWQWSNDFFQSTSLVTDNSKSICLRTDGINADGVNSWTQCNSSIGSANSSQATAVDLLSFTALREENGDVRVTWVTGSEINSFGFHVEASDHEFGPFVRQTDELILSKGGPTNGALYESVFEDMQNKFNFVRLVEIEISGIENIYGPVTISQFSDETSAKTNDSEPPTPTQESATPSSTAGESGVGPDQKSTPTTSKGCGALVTADDSHTSFVLLLLFVLIVLGSNRSHLVTKPFIHKTRKSDKSEPV